MWPKMRTRMSSSPLRHRAVTGNITSGHRHIACGNTITNFLSNFITSLSCCCRRRCCCYCCCFLFLMLLLLFLMLLLLLFAIDVAAVSVAVAVVAIATAFLAFSLQCYPLYMRFLVCPICLPNDFSISAATFPILF